jgi:hypothetical protein
VTGSGDRRSAEGLLARGGELGEVVYIDPATATDIRISPRARAFIDERGGRLFVWTESVGRAWLRVKASTSRPYDASEFEEWVVAGVRVFLASGASDVRSLKIGLRRFPRQKLVIQTGTVAGQVI